jgi:hypothetical protein
LEEEMAQLLPSNLPALEIATGQLIRRNGKYLQISFSAALLVSVSVSISILT